MKNNIFLLGAGFSHNFFNCPLTKDLIPMMKKYINESFEEIDKYKKNNYNSFTDIQHNIEVNSAKVINSYVLIIMLLNYWDYNISQEEKKFSIFNIKLFNDENTHIDISSSLYDYYVLKDSLVDTNDEGLVNEIEFKIFEDVSKIICDSAKVIDDKIDEMNCNFTNICSKLLFNIESLEKMQEMATHIYYKKWYDLFYIAIRFFLRDAFSNITKIKDDEKLKKFLNLLGGSLIFNFNWDNNFKNFILENSSYEMSDEYYEEINENKILYVNIHKTTDDFLLILPTSYRKDFKKEIYEFRSRIESYISKVSKSISNNFNIYIIGMSMDDYDSIFMFEIFDIFSKNNSINLSVTYFYYGKNDIKDAPITKYLSRKNIIKYENFEKIINYINNKNKNYM